MSHQSHFLTQQPAVFYQNSSDTTTVYYPPTTKQQTEKASDSLVNIVEYLAKEPVFPSEVGRDQNSKKEREYC